LKGSISGRQRRRGTVDREEKKKNGVGGREKKTRLAT